MRSLLLPLCLAAGLSFPAAFALAEGEEGLDPVSAEVKAQMEKIIRLMRENERALLEISTGGKAQPKTVDVDVPVPPAGSGSGGEGSGGNAGGSDGGSARPPEGGGSAGSGGDSPAGEDVRRALDELIRGQQEQGASIPGELEELVRMVPT